MTKYVLVLIRLVCLLTVLNGYSQENQWLKGTWKGVYFGEKSKLTKTFDTRLQIVKVNGSSFEGVVQCILPSDTTIRLHTRITGRIYAHHIMTKLKEVTYFKDPPGRYTWAKHCNLCDSMKYSFEKVGDSVVLQGERRCDTLCNIVARYSKNIGSLVYKAAFLYDTDITSRNVTAKTVGANTTAANTSAARANAKAVIINSNTPNNGSGTTAGNAGNASANTSPGANKAVAAATNTTKPNAANSTAKATGNTSNTTTGANKGATNTTNPNVTNNTKGTGVTTNTAANNTASTANTGGTSFDFVKPAYKDSLVGRDYFAGRAVTTPNRYIINADSAEIRFMDNGIVDGDTISVYYNGQLIVPKLSLKEKPYIIKVPLFPDYPNRLVIHAESLGEYPPNTALVRVISGKREESFLLSSSMNKSGSVELVNPQNPK